MPQAPTISVGWDIHTASIAVASRAQDPPAEVVSLGNLGTRQGDRDPRLRRRQSTSPPRVLVSAAGPCGSGRSRSRTTQGQRCGVVAPSVLPTKAGARVTTTRRAAIPLARLLRAGDRTPVDVPQVAAAALRDLRRARAEALRDLPPATCRLTAFLLRPESR
jgi:transposase